MLVKPTVVTRVSLDRHQAGELAFGGVAKNHVFPCSSAAEQRAVNSKVPSSNLGRGADDQFTYSNGRELDCSALVITYPTAWEPVEIPTLCERGPIPRWGAKGWCAALTSVTSAEQGPFGSHT